MKKKILILFLSVMAVILLCSCEEVKPKTDTSILTSFSVEGTIEANQVIISVKEKDSGREEKIKLTPYKIKEIEMEPGIYSIKKVSSGDKRISISLKEQYFTVNKANKIVSFFVEKEDKMTGVEWFFYNNSLYLLILVGCSVFLGINKYKKEKQLNMR